MIITDIIKSLFGFKNNSNGEDIIIKTIQEKQKSTLDKHVKVYRSVRGNISTYTYRSIITYGIIEVCLNFAKHIFSIKEDGVVMVEENDLAQFLQRLSKVTY